MRYEIPTEDDDWPPKHDVRVYDAANAMLGQQFGDPGTKLVMRYDYGDGWEIALTLEDILYDKELSGRELPRVLEGEGYGIVEDCGGSGGLERLALAFRQKFGQDYEELRVWLGRDNLDMTAYDKADMNFWLKKVPRIYRDIYEYGCAPSKRALAILERKKDTEQAESL